MNEREIEEEKVQTSKMKEKNRQRKRMSSDRSPTREWRSGPIIREEGHGGSRKKPKPQIAFGRRVPLPYKASFEEKQV